TPFHDTCDIPDSPSLGVTFGVEIDDFALIVLRRGTLPGRLGKCKGRDGRRLCDWVIAKVSLDPFPIGAHDFPPPPAMSPQLRIPATTNESVLGQTACGDDSG